MDIEARNPVADATPSRQTAVNDTKIDEDEAWEIRKRFWQYGFLRRRSTGSVDLGNGVYDGGRYLVGPDYTFKVFKADGHHVQFRNLSVFSGDKLETFIDVDLVYYLDKSRLVLLHNTYERHYAPVVEGRATDAIKNTAPRYGTEAFFTRRLELEQALLDAVRARLNEVYCTCDILYLQSVRIPDEVAQRQLKTAVQKEANLQEQYVQNATVYRTQTDRLVNDINNNATIVLEQANIDALHMVSFAETAANQQLELAKQSGLQYMYNALNITSAAHKASLDYIRTLRNADNAQVHVGYNTKISTFNN